MDLLKLIVCCACISIGSGHLGRAADREASQLPSKATELLGKLSEFETSETLACNVRIANAEKSALAILAKQQKQEEKRGNLDAVLALRGLKEISEEAKPGAALPDASKATIKKFQTYAKAQRSALVEKTAQKQQAVAQILTRMVTEETRNGNVDVAVALRSAVEKLKIEVKAKPSVAKKPDLFEEKPKLGLVLKRIHDSPATVETDGSTGSLDPEKGWANIPKPLLGAQVHGGKSSNGGVTNFKVLTSGYAIVACNYAYQGNNSGGWTDTRWLPEDFKKNGWRELDEKDLGGKLVNSRSQPLRIFYKKLPAGEEGSLRCNKYGAPTFLTLATAGGN